GNEPHLDSESIINNLFCHRMKKLLKIGGVLLGLLLLGLLVFLWARHEPLPEGKTGPEADALAQKMLKALNFEAYRQTRYLEWSYRNGKNQYLWDKDLGHVTVRWDDIRVDLNLNDPAKSSVTKNGKQMDQAQKEKEVSAALKNFNNDSFWLVAPFKVFDSGTTRSIVSLGNGEKGLLVTYASGGTTPGDSYLWLLNEDGFPNAYKMWVNIIPIGGVMASWDDWMVVDSGAFLPKSHQLGPLTLNMGDVKGYN
ncbi:MAG: hypothetical protein AAFX53_14080, partial [Bacteroidota bacterium]